MSVRHFSPVASKQKEKNAQMETTQAAHKQTQTTKEHITPETTLNKTNATILKETEAKHWQSLTAQACLAGWQQTGSFFTTEDDAPLPTSPH